MFFILIFFLTLTTKTLCIRQDYYWRDYTGTIPKDAVAGGTNSNGDNIYIGQALVRDRGLIVAQINPGVREVEAPIGGVRKVANYIKILCGPADKFRWIQGDAKSLHLTLIGKHAVLGGTEDDKHLNIGRVHHDGVLKIGKVDSWSAGSADFYFADRGAEKMLKNYEILVYESEDEVISFDPRIHRSHRTY